MRDSTGLLKMFHASDFEAVATRLGAVPREDLTAMEMYWLGVSLIRLRRSFPDAVALLADAEARGYRDVWLKYWRCHGLIGLKEHGRTVRAVLAVLAEEPGFEPAQKLLGDLLERAGRIGETVPCFQDVAGAFAEAFDSVFKALKAASAGTTAVAVPRGETLGAMEQSLIDLAVLSSAGRREASPYRLKTDHPVAIYSADHISPRGTLADNTRSPRFVRACER